jgi:hypothetical protein
MFDLEGDDEAEDELDDILEEDQSDEADSLPVISEVDDREAA